MSKTFLLFDTNPTGSAPYFGQIANPSLVVESFLLKEDGQERQQEDQPLDKRLVFARIFAQNDRWLYAYLMTLLGSPAHTEEVFQDVCVVLWREYEVFDPETNFRKWASVIAHNQVRRFRRSQSRHELRLSDKAIDLLAEESEKHWDLMESRRMALHGCLQKLNSRDRDLVKQCYSATGKTFRSVAEQLGRPANTVYKAINRIRKALHQCIDRTIAANG